jgi:phospholipase/carboxylesterase
LCHAWYDIRSLNRFRLPEEKVFDLDQVRESQEILSSHVSEEINHWYKEDPDSPINPYHRVFVGGFSQGGVIALRYALEAKEPPAGAICFSGYFLQTTQLNNLGKVPILLMHGKDDTVINESEAKNSYNPIFLDKHLV